MSRTLLGPLTTTFTPPGTCTSFFGNATAYSQDGRSLDSSTFWAGQNCNTTLFSGALPSYIATPQDATECWPKATIPPITTPFAGYGFYSPGFYCPSGYTTACAAARDMNGASVAIPGHPSFGFEFPLLANETAYGCCPDGLSCYIDSTSAQSCLATTIPTSSVTTQLSLASTVTTILPLWYCELGPGRVTPGPQPILGPLDPSPSFFAPLIQINRNGLDNTSDRPSVLSTGAKIGIGVGVGLGVVLLLAILFFILKRRRSRRRRGAALLKNRPVFKIAIICALSSEAGMIEMILDKDWADEGLQLVKASGDQNTYTAGAIRDQNVILAYLPRMGSNSAAAVASGLRASFHEIEVAFVVGICGITPRNVKTQEEIVLGDCVVSTSVIQYDFGRQYPGGFVRKNSADNTVESGNARIRSWISMLMTARNQDRLTKRFHETLESLQGAELGKAIRFPGAHRDRLFESSYIHKHRPAGSCPKCVDGLGTCLSDCDDVGCESEFVVRRSEMREPLRSLEIPPKIHFGRFGSANTVMRSGVDRDNLASRDQIVAFEMEGSGVWDVFPTVVVKSGCDYADSHKSKEWQSYAAATAAACLKALIEKWSSLNESKVQ